MAERRTYGAGKRDRTVMIEQLTESVGPSRFPVGTWVPLCTLQAGRDDVGGRERFAADQVSAPFDTRWDVNYRPDLDPELIDVTKTRRLVFAGRVYDIVAAQQIGRKDGIELLTLASSHV